MEKNKRKGQLRSAAIIFLKCFTSLMPNKQEKRWKNCRFIILTVTVCTILPRILKNK